MKILIIIFSLFITGGGPLYEQYKKSVDKSISFIVGESTTEFIVTESHHEFYQVKSPSGTYYLALSSATGRFDKFDYLTILNEKLEIETINILKYRSEYGYEISNKKWLKQFYNKADTEFVYGRNIDALSGASFSAPSIVDDINLIREELKTLSGH